MVFVWRCVGSKNGPHKFIMTAAYSFLVFGMRVKIWEYVDPGELDVKKGPSGREINCAASPALFFKYMNHKVVQPTSRVLCKNFVTTIYFTATQYDYTTSDKYVVKFLHHYFAHTHFPVKRQILHPKKQKSAEWLSANYQADIQHFPDNLYWWSGWR